MKSVTVKKTERLKDWKQQKAGVMIFRSGIILLLFLLQLSVAAFAESDGFTLSLLPSTETVVPGDIVKLTVQVHNDGWPQSGEAEVAAFQAKLDYERSSLEYVGIEIPEGTMGDYSPESGVVLGYGEGHRFQETLDCAVLTMKVAEGVSGQIPVTIQDVILGRQDATELKVSPSGTLTLQVAGAESGGVVSAQDGDRPPVDPEGSAGPNLNQEAAVTGSKAAPSTGTYASRSENPVGSGENTEQTGEKSVNNDAAPANAGIKKKSGTTNVNEPAPGTGTVSSENHGVKTVADPTDQVTKEKNGNSLLSDNRVTATGVSGGQADGIQTVSQPVWQILWGIVPIAVAAVAGIWIWRIRRGHSGAMRRKQTR